MIHRRKSFLPTKCYLLFHNYREIPNRVWALFFINALHSFYDFALEFSLVLYMKNELEMGIERAEMVYMVWSLIKACVAIPCGVFVDRAGLRPGLIVGAILNFFSMVVITFSQNETFFLVALYAGTTIGGALFDRGVSLSIRRQVVTESSRKIAFSWLYISFNIAAVLALWFIDYAMRSELYVCCYKLIYLTTMVATFCALVLSLAVKIKDEIKVSTDPLTMKDYIHTFREPNMYALLVFQIILIPAKSIFQYMGALVPAYLEIVSPEAPMGVVLSINPITIPFFVLFYSIVLKKLSLFKMFVSGTTISALSIAIAFFWYTNYDFGSYQLPLGLMLSILVFTNGEAIYSPYIENYILSISPILKQGLYSGITPLPAKAGAALAGYMSSYYLRIYCSTGELEVCRQVWLNISAMSLLTPIGLIMYYVIIYKWLKKDFNTEDEFYIGEKRKEWDASYYRSDSSSEELLSRGIGYRESASSSSSGQSKNPENSQYYDTSATDRSSTSGEEYQRTYGCQNLDTSDASYYFTEESSAVSSPATAADSREESAGETQ